MIVDIFRGAYQESNLHIAGSRESPRSKGKGYYCIMMTSHLSWVTRGTLSMSQCQPVPRKVHQPPIVIIFIEVNIKGIFSTCCQNWQFNFYNNSGRRLNSLLHENYFLLRAHLNSRPLVVDIHYYPRLRKTAVGVVTAVVAAEAGCCCCRGKVRLRPRRLAADYWHNWWQAVVKKWLGGVAEADTGLRHTVKQPPRRFTVPGEGPY